MHLLHRENGRLKRTEYVGHNPPPYAVLSHRWGAPSDEVTFEDLTRGVGNETRSKPGYAKIDFCLNQAQADGLDYVWCDTCCIDKRNNVELSEAINSMFRWYDEAVKCYVYMSDVPEKSFEDSVWFQRGWTLQELLAPAEVEFFNSSRVRMGTKASLMAQIRSATGLPLKALQGYPLSRFSIEEKFSWIERRQTQRPEDMAYCLHGIFGVHMPLLYGEGMQRAFARLKRQIQEDMRLDGAAHTPTMTKKWTGTMARAWRQAVDIEKVSRAVVALRVAHARGFDMVPATSAYVTGFVVDRKRGYILTCRLWSGPIWGYATFENGEECPIRPVYRDPVHDFGIFHFNPKIIKYLALTELAIQPEQAKVGLGVRVINKGGDSDALNITAGTINSVSQNPPAHWGYYDFDTNHVQISAQKAGVGGPVIDLYGNAIALCPGRGANFLPLHRPLRTLRCIRKGIFVSRGTIQVQWLITSMTVCRRLGLSEKMEVRIRKRFPKDTSILVATMVIQDGPADGKIMSGDILTRVNGELVIHHARFEDILDKNVGSTVTVTVYRLGNEIQLELEVGDLHAITPDRFVTIAGGTFHDISYMQARNFGSPVKGVAISQFEGSFTNLAHESGCIIESVDHHPVGSLQELIQVARSIPDKSQLALTYRWTSDKHKQRTTAIYFRTSWLRTMRMAVRNNRTGSWDFKDLSTIASTLVPMSRSARFIQLEPTCHPVAADIVRSFVRVVCTLPVRIEGFAPAFGRGPGLIVSADQGLVLVSRSVVPHDLCDITITIADSIVVEGEVVFLHPLANYAILRFDPKLVNANMNSARLATTQLERGSQAVFVCTDEIMATVQTTVTNSALYTIDTDPRSCCYRTINQEFVSVESALCSQYGSGVLITSEGTIGALWMSFKAQKTDVYHLGVKTPSIVPLVELLCQHKAPILRIVDVEFEAVSMSICRTLGVPESWIDVVVESNPYRRQLLRVVKVSCLPDGHQSIPTLLDGDIVLTLDNQLANSARCLDALGDKDVIEAVVVRQGRELTIQIATVSAEDLTTDHVLVMSGIILHAPHHAVRQRLSMLPSQIYVAGIEPGSPGELYSISSSDFVTGVNGVAVHTIQDLRSQVGGIPNDTYFTLEMVNERSDSYHATIKKIINYFPTQEFVRERMGKWITRYIDGNDSGDDLHQGDNELDDDSEYETVASSLGDSDEYIGVEDGVAGIVEGGEPGAENVTLATNPTPSSLE